MNESKQTIELTLPETPDEIIVNGEKFRRVEADYAIELIRRIKTISRVAICTEAQAAWAIKHRTMDYQPYPDR